MFNKKIAVGIASLALVAGAAAPAALAYPQETAPSFDSQTYTDITQAGDSVWAELDDVKPHCSVRFTLGNISKTVKAQNDYAATTWIKTPSKAGEYILRAVVSDKCGADAGHRNWITVTVGDEVVVSDDSNETYGFQTANKGLGIDGQVEYTSNGNDINGYVHVKIYDGSKLLDTVATDNTGYFAAHFPRSTFGARAKTAVLKFVIINDKNFYSFVPPQRISFDLY